MSEPADTIRLDKWLWYARFFKSRSLAGSIVSSGKVRVNGTPVSKPSRTVKPDDVLTFSKERDVKVVRVISCGIRRGPAPEAQQLYEDLSPEPVARPANPRFDGKGRPTKKDRRDMSSQFKD